MLVNWTCGKRTCRHHNVATQAVSWPIRSPACLTQIKRQILTNIQRWAALRPHCHDQKHKLQVRRGIRNTKCCNSKPVASCGHKSRHPRLYISVSAGTESARLTHFPCLNEIALRCSEPDLPWYSGQGLPSFVKRARGKPRLLHHEKPQSVSSFFNFDLH
jgi:hypothetical protein